jgi:hypothetical protein
MSNIDIIKVMVVLYTPVFYLVAQELLSWMQ